MRDGIHSHFQLEYFHLTYCVHLRIFQELIQLDLFSCAVLTFCSLVRISCLNLMKFDNGIKLLWLMHFSYSWSILRLFVFCFFFGFFGCYSQSSSSLIVMIVFPETEIWNFEFLVKTIQFFFLNSKFFWIQSGYIDFPHLITEWVNLI